MKYLKKFDLATEYDEYINSDAFILPNVSYIIENNDVKFHSLIQSKNSTIYATFNATSDNMTALYNTSNVKSLIVDDKEIPFDPEGSNTIINIIGENITMNLDDDQNPYIFPKEYCFMLLNNSPSSWTFKPTDTSMDEINYIALIGIVGGHMEIYPIPTSDILNQGTITYDDINNVFCVSELILEEISQGYEGLNFVCMKVDEANSTFTFLDTITNINYLPSSKYIFDSEGNHTMEIELIDDTVIPQTMFCIIEDLTTHYESCLTSITIPDSVTSISDRTFSLCKDLTSVKIGSGVTSIGESVFWGCENLTSVEIGSSVTSISGYAFESCTNLNEITCLAITAPSIDKYTFSNIKTDGTLHIPTGSDYSSWMSMDEYYLGYYNWTTQEL